MQTNPVPRGVPVQTLRRLPAYLTFLRRIAGEGRPVVSCTHIALDLGLDPTLVRKDLQFTGIVGRPKVGYQVPALIAAVESFLGWDNATEAVVVGVGGLGRALLGYEGFAKHGLSIVAGFDVDPTLAGTQVRGKPVFHLDRLADLVERLHIHLGVLAVPQPAAQEATNVMVLSGIRAIWNFTGAKLDVTPDLLVEDVDLAASLAVLSSKLERSVRVQRTEG